MAALRGFRAPTPAVDVPCVPLRRVAGSSQSNGYRQRAGSLSRDQPQADFGRDTAQLHVWRLVQHVRMHRCGRRVGFRGGCAHASTLSAPCTTWLVAFALNLPASLVPPSSRSTPAARSLRAAGKPLRRHGSINLAMTACSVAFAYSFQASWHRLTGQRPNESECYYAGVPFEKVN